MKKAFPLISVCVPVYNNEATLEKTLGSILNQDYPNFEIIIIDDKSLDSSIKIVEKYKDKLKDKSITLIKNHQNLGMTKNWNKCLSFAKGELIKLICADDLLKSSCLREESKAFLKHPEISMAISDSMLITETGEKLNTIKRCFKPGLNNGHKLGKFSLVLNNFFGAPCNVTFSKKHIDKIGGFDENFNLIPDFDLWIRLAHEGDVFIIQKTLSSFTVRRGSNTWEIIKSRKTRQKYLLEHKILFKKHQHTFKLSIHHLALSIGSRIIRSYIISRNFAYLLRKS